MTPTPRTDAQWQSITATSPWDAAAEQMRQHARQLERENQTFRAAQKACEDCDAPRVDRIAELESDLATWESELSKVMPPDFKDWWQNSKSEWPLVARLVIESKTEWGEMIDAEVGTLREELADERALADRLAAWLSTLLSGYDDAKEIAPFDGTEAHAATRALAAWKEARNP